MEDNDLGLCSIRLRVATLCDSVCELLCFSLVYGSFALWLVCALTPPHVSR